MNQLTLSALTVLTAVCGAFAGPLEHKQIPAGSAWLAHFDFESFRSSQLGQLVINEINLKHQEQIDNLQGLLGSNLLTDIDSLTLYGSDADEKNAVSLIEGRFDKQKLLAFLKLNPAYSEVAHERFTLYKWFDDKRQKEQIGTFADDNRIVIAQTQPVLETAINVLAGKEPSLADRAKLPLFSLSQAPKEAFIVAAAEGLSQLAGQEHAAILQNSNFLIFITSEQDGVLKVHLQLESETEESAVQIEQVVRGMLAFATLQMKEQPELQKIIQSGVISRNARNLQFNFLAPSADLFQLMKSFEEQKHNSSAAVAGDGA